MCYNFIRQLQHLFGDFKEGDGEIHVIVKSLLHPVCFLDLQLMITDTNAVGCNIGHLPLSNAASMTRVGQIQEIDEQFKAGTL